MPAVSVLMPCYNSASTLGEALDSLASQSLVDYEVIAVDDGSTDGTAEILEERARGDSRIRPIRIRHGGIISALNAGLEACRSELIARMDADDRCAPQRMEKQAAFLEANTEVDVVGSLVAGFPAENVRGGFRVYIDWLNSLVSCEDIRREIFVESPLAHPSVMFRKTAVKEAGGYQDRGWAEDYDLWLRMYTAGKKFAKVPEVLLEWRETPERLTRSDSRYSLENFLRAKSYYLVRGPLAGRDAVVIWGAGMMGRRLSKHLLRLGAPLAAFIDIDPNKIGHTRRGIGVLPPEMLVEKLQEYERPVVLAAVGARGARMLIREQLNGMGLVEGKDWWAAA